jgi:hypothetical protein
MIGCPIVNPSVKRGCSIEIEMSACGEIEMSSFGTDSGKVPLAPGSMRFPVP